MINNLKSFFNPARGVVNTSDVLDFKQIYLEHEAFIRKSVYWLSRTNDIDDIVQETFIKAWKNFDKFEKNSSIRTWLYKIARNTTIDYLRKNKVKKIEEAAEELNPNYEEKDLINYVFSRMKLEERELLTLAYKFEYSYKEIGEFLEIKEGTVKSRLNSAKKNFTEITNKLEEQNG